MKPSHHDGVHRMHEEDIEKRAEIKSADVNIVVRTGSKTNLQATATSFSSDSSKEDETRSNSIVKSKLAKMEH